MQKITKETIKNLVKLSRIGCSESEQDSLLNDLDKIVAYVELLQEVDTTGLSPCNHVLAWKKNVVREDVVGETMPRDVFLSNVPSQIGGMIKVPPVIKSN